MWRIFKKVALFVAGGLALLILVLVISGFLYIQTSHFQSLIRNQVVEGLESRFPVRVELASAHLEVWSGRLTLEQFRLFDVRPEVVEPAIDIERVTLNYSIKSFFSPAASLDQLELEKLRIRIIQEENDRLNLANLFVPEPGSGTGSGGFSGFIRLAIKEVSLSEALILYNDQPFLLDSVDGAMSVQMEFLAEERVYFGRAELQNFSLTVAGFLLPEFSCQVQFRLDEDRIELPVVSIETAQVRGQVAGSIVNLRDLIYEFEVDLQVDPAQIKTPDLASILRGPFQTTGSFTGQKGDFLYAGDFSSRGWAVNRWSFGETMGRVRVNRESVAVEQMRAAFTGGEVRADGEMSWDEERLSKFHVKASRIAIEPLVAAMVSGSFRFSGRAAFEGDVKWPGTRLETVLGEGDVSYEAGFQLLEPQGDPVVFPIDGSARVNFNRELVQLQDGWMDTLEGRLSYGGSIDFEGRYALDFRMTSDRDERILTLAGLAQLGDLDLWDKMSFGSLTASGQLSGGDEPYRLEGDSEFSSLQLRGQTLGDLRTTFVLTPEVLLVRDGRLEGEDQAIAFAAEISRRADRAFPVNALEADVSRTNVGTVLRALDLDFPVQGMGSGVVTLGNSESGVLEGWTEFEVRDGEIAEQPLSLLRGRLDWTGPTVRVTRLETELGEGRLTASGQAELPFGSFEMQVQGEKIALEAVTLLAREIPVQGTADLRIVGTGSLQSPRVQVSLTAEQLTMADQNLTDFRLELQSSGSDWPTSRFTAQSTFQGYDVALQGTLGLAAPFPLNASAEFDQFTLAPFLSALPSWEGINVEGEASGRVEVTGDLETPESVSVSASLPRLHLSLAGYDVQNQTPVAVRYEGQTIRIEPVTFVGQETRLQVEGMVQKDEGTLRLNADGQMNLMLLNPFLKGGATAGQVNLEVLVAGPLTQPRILGKADLDGVFLRYPDMPATVLDAHGKLRFTADQISIDELSASTSLGELGAEGGIFLEGWKPIRWLINIFGSGLRLEYPRQVFSLLDLDVDLVRSETSQLLSGVVYVRSADYREEISLPELILRYGSSQSSPAAITGLETVLDIDVEGYHTFRIDNNLADLVASGDFKVRGTLQDPIILGSTRVESGRLFLEHNEYEIVRGTIAFNDPRRTRPFFNFEAQTEVRDYNVNVLLRGPLDQLNFSFRSDPPLPSSSIVTLLALGQTQEELFGGDGQRQGQAGSLALYGAGTLLTKGLGRGLQEKSSRLFGLERFSLDPFLLGNERNPAAQLTLGKQLSDNVSVTYSTVLGGDDQGQVVVMQVKLTDWLSLVGSGDQAGAIAIDFKLKKRF